MTEQTTPETAPATVSYQVTAYRRLPGQPGGSYQVTSAETTSAEAIGFIQEHLAAATADGLVEIVPDTPADPTSPASGTSLTGSSTGSASSVPGSAGTGEAI